MDCEATTLETQVHTLWLVNVVLFHARRMYAATVDTLEPDTKKDTSPTLRFEA